MNLDRNTNRGGAGKYALVNMRLLLPIIDALAKHIPGNPVKLGEYKVEEALKYVEAFELLLKAKIITLGNEAPGDQFFVMKYKDKFTADGLMGYAHAVEREAIKVQDVNQCRSLMDYAAAMRSESFRAKEYGNRIPD